MHLCIINYFYICFAITILLMKTIRIKPPFIALYYLLVFIILNKLIPGTKIIFSPFNLFGIIISILGFFLIFWAAFSFKKEDTPKNPFKKPTSLVIRGPFLLTRNPMYIGLTLILIGISIYVGTIVLFLAPLLFFITIHSFFIPYEENKLVKIFGKDYLHYKKRVRRWI